MHESPQAFPVVQTRQQFESVLSEQAGTDPVSRRARVSNARATQITQSRGLSGSLIATTLG